MNLTVTSKGRQFDRLAIMYINDTEVYRTSTAEPTRDGIRWEYHKDMTAFMSLWNSPQKIIFDLGNLINDIYTGAFNATLIATFSVVEDSIESASAIIPISARRSADNAPSLFMLPGDRARNTVQLPRNIKRAIFSIAACGQAEEEFFWANTLQSNTETFSNTTGVLYGHSPFREVQVLIDGQIAGVQWPFPTIFTGGVVPGLWKPIVGIGAFDLREHEIDISPWLPILCDGKEHTFELKVFGIEDHGDTVALTDKIGSSWYVTGKIFIWQDDDPKAVTSGRVPTVLLPTPVIELTSSSTYDKEGSNKTLQYIANVKRTLSVSSLVTTKEGTHLNSWTQTLSIETQNQFAWYGEEQKTIHNTTGIDQSTDPYPYTSKHHYNLLANSSYTSDDDGTFTINADLVQKYDHEVLGTSIFKAPSKLTTELAGSAYFYATPGAEFSGGYGTTAQTYSYTSKQDRNEYEACRKIKSRDRYFRAVLAINGVVDINIEEVCQEEAVVPKMVQKSVVGPHSNDHGVIGTPRQYLGRGPGKLKREYVREENIGT